MSADPFGTGRLRDTVLAVWASDPARLREDANSEEDHARGGYRDRVVVELAQNAADAAARASTAQVPGTGRLHLELLEHPDGTGLLVAANTGVPLDRAGVASLASLRASAKQGVGAQGVDAQGAGAQVGRFGVGFAAVRSVADEVAVLSRTGDVHFSLERTAAALAGIPAVAGTVARREGVLPALRLPFAGPGAAGEATPVHPGDPAGVGGSAATWDTVVVLALRDAAATAAVRTQLGEVGDPLLLALPALTSVSVRVAGTTRVVADAAQRWVVATGSGTLDARLLADRPVEERSRTVWQITWAAPRPGTAPAPPQVHAPTPTDEPCTVPALLIGTFPLDPTRRHVARGPLTDALVSFAGDVWAGLLTACRPGTATAAAPGAPGVPHALDLVPSGLPAGTLDAALRAAVVAAGRTAPVLTPADGGPPLAPTEAMVLAGPAGDDAALLAALGARLPHLVPAGAGRRAALRLLGVEEVELADVVETLPPLPPPEHRALLDAVAGAGPTALEALATLAVPLVDGRTVRGVRGATVLAGRMARPDDAAPDPATVLAGWGLRVVHPDAAHPLHERLGAEVLDAAGLLHHPVVRAQVLAGEDETGTAEVLLALVETALADGDVSAAAWWGEVLLPAEDGEPVPARGLVLPGSDAARWFDPEVLPPVDADLAERWQHVLPVLGVRTGLPLVPVPAGAAEVPAAADEVPDDVELVLDQLDGWADYVEALEDLAAGDQPLAVEQPAVADLDAVRPGCWPEVLRALADGPARRALASPGAGAAGPLPSYTAWWLRHRSPLGIDGPFALPGAPAGLLAGLLPGAPETVRGLDRELQRALGGVERADDVDAEGWGRLLDRLPPVGRRMDVGTVVRVWRALADVARDDEDAVLPVDRLPAMAADGTVVVVPVEEVAVATVQWAQLSRTGPHVVVPAAAAPALAAALDVDLAQDRSDGRVTSSGLAGPVPDAVREAFPTAPSTWSEHEDLRVDGEAVDWWVERAGTAGAALHACTTAGLARAVAHVVGWQHRDTVERLLQDPGALTAVLLELAGLDEHGGPDGLAGAARAADPDGTAGRGPARPDGSGDPGGSGWRGLAG